MSHTSRSHTSSEAYIQGLTRPGPVPSSGESLKPSTSSKKQTTVTPRQYVEAIYAHSQRSIVSSSFPGQNYIDLANWLLKEHSGTNSSYSTVTNRDRHHLAVLHNLDQLAPEKGPLLLTQSDLPRLTTHHPPERGDGHVLFLQGFLSPQWIAEIGSKYRVDAEFIHRHLDFFASSVHRGCFSLPSLPSTSNNIIHINVNTIICDHHSPSILTSDLLDRRREAAEHMVRYKRQLQTSARCGDSLVREYGVLNDQFSVIEQRISVCMCRNGDGWLALVWMDIGRSLSDSPPNPWTDHRGPRASALPIIQHHPKMTLRKIGESEKHERSTRLESPFQSTAVLPMDYASILSAVDLANQAKSEPLAAVIPIFAHAAFSEAAFLNFIRELVREEMNPLSRQQYRIAAFENLQYLEGILDRHVAQLNSCIKGINMLAGRSQYQPSRNRSHLSGLGESSDQAERTAFPGTTGTFSAQGILQDYEYLLETCTHLRNLCATAMDVDMNKTMIAEARKAMEQTERMKKLSLLATYFIPLTFTASLFGMNFDILGQGKQPVWWYFVFALPLTVMTHFLNSCDMKTLMTNLSSWARDRWKKRAP